MNMTILAKVITSIWILALLGVLTGCAPAQPASSGQETAITPVAEEQVTEEQKETVLEAWHGRMNVKLFLREPTEAELNDTSFIAASPISSVYSTKPGLVVDSMEVHLGSSHPKSFNRTFYSDLTNITDMYFEEIDGEPVLTIKMYDQDFNHYTAQYWFVHNIPSKRIVRDDMNPEDYQLLESVFVEP